MSDTVPTNWLTHEAFDRLTAELETLRTTGRDEIAHKIELAREEGDLKENAGYHAAKDEQGKMEARITQLTVLLRDTEVGEAPASKGVVEPGTVVTATIAGDKSVFLIGNREMAGDNDLSVYSSQSPLGIAILGLKVGDKASYEAPNGKKIQVSITKVENYLAR